MALLYIAPSIFLWRYADSIRNLMNTHNVVHLEDAMQNQKSFWKFVGIAAIVLMVIYALAIMSFIFLGTLAATRSTGS